MDSHIRSVEFRMVDGDGDGRTLEGYAAVFNQPTDIRDHLGVYRETIAPGAFAKTISERTPVLQFDHGHHPMIGSIPLGVIDELREDDHGLYVRATLHESPLFDPVRESIQSRAIQGMSFRFAATRDKWNKEQNDRTVIEAKVFELGPVVFPAYEATSVLVRMADVLGVALPSTEEFAGSGPAERSAFLRGFRLS